MNTDEVWMSMSDAAFHLRNEGFDISVSKLSRMAKKGQIRTDTDPIDQRAKLVDLNELRNIFSTSKRHRA